MLESSELAKLPNSQLAELGVWPTCKILSNFLPCPPTLHAQFFVTPFPQNQVWDGMIVRAAVMQLQPAELYWG